MKSLNRIIGLMLAAAVVLALFGCGAKQSAENTPAKRPAAAKRAAGKSPAESGKKKTKGNSPETPVDLEKLFGQSAQPSQTPGAVLPWQTAAPQSAAPAAPGARPATPAPTAGPPPAVPVKRPTAKQLLTVVQNLYRSAQSLRLDGSIDTTVTQDGKVVERARAKHASFMFKRPNRFVMKDPQLQLYSDGKTVYNYVVPAKRYVKTPMTEDLLRTIVLSKPGVGVMGLLLGVDYVQASSSLTLLPDSKVGNRETYVLSMALKTPKGVTATQKLWIAKNDLGVYKNQLVTEVRPKAPKGSTGKIPKVIRTDTSNTVSKIEANLKLPDSAFVFKPPSGARVVRPPKRIDLTGKHAPDFAFKWTDGSEKKLSDLRGKPVVLYFWALPQGAEHLSVIQELHEQHKDDLHLIAVNLNVESGKVDEYLRKKNLSFAVVHSTEAVAKTAAEGYGLMSIPVTFIIDGEGVVRSVLTGTPTVKAIEDKLPSGG